MRNLIATVLLIVSQAPTGADAIVASSVSTTELIESCRRAGNTMRMDCAGYTMGVYDQMSFSRLICPPRRSTVAAGDATICTSTSDSVTGNEQLCPRQTNAAPSVVA